MPAGYIGQGITGQGGSSIVSGRGGRSLGCGGAVTKMDTWLDITIEAEVSDKDGNRCSVQWDSGNTHSEHSSRRLFVKLLSEFGLSVVNMEIVKNEEHDWGKDEHVVDGQQICTQCGRMTERDETNTLSVTIPNCIGKINRKFTPLCDECYDRLYDRKLELDAGSH